MSDATDYYIPTITGLSAKLGLANMEIAQLQAEVERLEAKLETAEEAIRGGQNWAWYQWSIGETK